MQAAKRRSVNRFADRRAHRAGLAHRAHEIAGAELADDVDRADALRRATRGASSSFGIMPPVMMPSAIAARASAAVSAACATLGSFMSRSTPGADGDEEQRARALSARGELVGDGVGVDVEDVALRVGAEAARCTGTSPAAQSVEQREVDAGDVADQAEVDGSGPPPATTVGGRFAARTSAAPTRRAGRPAARRRRAAPRTGRR